MHRRSAVESQHLHNQKIAENTRTEKERKYKRKKQGGP
jgi:hypothetical protein